MLSVTVQLYKYTWSVRVCPVISSGSVERRRDRGVLVWVVIGKSIRVVLAVPESVVLREAYVEIRPFRVRAFVVRR